MAIFTLFLCVTTKPLYRNPDNKIDATDAADLARELISLNRLQVLALGSENARRATTPPHIVPCHIILHQTMPHLITCSHDPTRKPAWGCRRDCPVAGVQESQTAAEAVPRQ